MEAFPPKRRPAPDVASAAAEAVLSAAAFSLKVSPWGGLSFHVYRPGAKAMAFASMDPENGLFSIVEFRGPGFMEERTHPGLGREALGRRLTEIFFGGADDAGAFSQAVISSSAAAAFACLPPISG